MSEGRPSPVERVGRPKRALPAGAADCHAHVFGPFDRYPLALERNYQPLELPGDRYLAMLDRIGFSRGVLVQPTAHGTDCRALLHALDLGRGRLRGIAAIRAEIGQDQLEEMHRRGVRGARFCHMPGEPLRGAVDFDELERLSPRLAKLGWHAQILSRCQHLVAAMPRLESFGLPLVVDHMALFEVDRGLADPSFQALLRLLREARIWLKLTPCHLSRRYPDYEDLVPFHEALLAANGKQLLWGSDWPHVGMPADVPDAGHLVDLFDRWTDDELARQRILVDNPARLYGFADGTTIVNP